jgi:hypothetical protein
VLYPLQANSVDPLWQIPGGMQIPKETSKEYHLKGIPCILDIFAGMKKYNIIIFLSFLFILAFVHANFIAFQAINTTASITIKSNTCFSTDFNYPGSEIERGSIHSYTGFVNKVIQQLPGHLTANTKSLALSSLFFSPVVFSNIELSRNNSLLHNYPSHNFW